MFNKDYLPLKEKDNRILNTPIINTSNPLIQFYSGEGFIGEICSAINKFYKEKLSIGIQNYKFDDEESIIIAISSPQTHIVHIHRKIIGENKYLRKESIQIGLGRRDDKLADKFQGKNLTSKIYNLENSWIKDNQQNMLIHTDVEHIATYHMNMQYIQKETITINAFPLNRKRTIMHQATMHPTYNIPYNQLTGKLGMRLNNGRHIYATYTIEGRLA